MLFPCLLLSPNLILLPLEANLSLLLGLSFGLFSASSHARVGRWFSSNTSSAAECSIWRSDSSRTEQAIKALFSFWWSHRRGSTRSFVCYPARWIFFKNVCVHLFCSVVQIYYEFLHLPVLAWFLWLVLHFQWKAAFVLNLGRTLSTRTVWTSDSMIQTRSNQGSGKPLHAVLSAGGQFIEYSNVFSYDVPAISSFLANGPTNGSVIFVKLGSNFGGLQTSSRAKVGITAYFSTFISDSSIGSFTLAPCASLPSFNLHAQVEVGVDSATQVSGFVLFSYDPPHISSWSALHRPISGLAIVTLFGNHFGPQELTLNPKIRLLSACSAPLFVSYTAIYCKIPALILRPSQNLDVIMGLGDQRATLSRAFTYEVPEVDTVYRHNVPSSGNVLVTFSGRRIWCRIDRSESAS